MTIIIKAINRDTGLSDDGKTKLMIFLSSIFTLNYSIERID
jgi:hypothetical protein